MKNYRLFVPLILAAMLFGSWHSLTSRTAEVESSYQDALETARSQAKKGIKVEAQKNYLAAMEIKNEPELYVEYAEFLKTQGKASELIDWCEYFQEQFPKEPVAYDYLLDAYYSTKDYEACFDVMTTAEKRKVTSDKIKEIAAALMYEYKLDYETYSDVGIYSNFYCAVKNSKGKWGFVNRFGDSKTACKYDEVGTFTSSGFASVVFNGESYFINNNGEKILASEKNYLRFGQLTGNMVCAQRSDGRYVYLDAQLDESAIGEYAFASAFNCGIAAVQNDNLWTLIGPDGKQAVRDSYQNVILDEKQIAFRAERAFVSQDGKSYYMINTNGERIGSLEFEDARLFTSQEPTAVKINGKWCFINTEGERISDKTYDEARAFANGLAAVSIDGKWGFLDESETIVIAAQFDGAIDFNEKGSCFVKKGEQWQLLKLFRLNRRDG